MKKTKAKKNLLFSTEKIRDLRPMTEDQLREAAGGQGCTGSLCTNGSCHITGTFSADC